MTQEEHAALLAGLGPVPLPRGRHDWAPPIAASYCRKCGTQQGTWRAAAECPR